MRLCACLQTTVPMSNCRSSGIHRLARRPQVHSTLSLFIAAVNEGQSHKTRLNCAFQRPFLSALGNSCFRTVPVRLA